MSDNALIKKLDFVCNGQAVQVLEVDGEPMIDAGHLSEVLGYSDRARLPNLIRQKWVEEFAEGRHYRFVHINSVGPNGANRKNNRPRLLLTEFGWNLVFVKTRKPVGQELRRFLTEEVMPQLARTGQYVPGGPTHDEALQAAVARNTAALEELRQGQRDNRVFQVKTVEALTHIAERMDALNQRLAIGAAPPGAVMATSSVALLPPVVPEGFTIRGLSGLGRGVGCTHKQMKGRLIAVELWNDPQWVWQGQEPVMTGSGKLRQQRLYCFRPGIINELLRREKAAERGPLFPQGEQGEQPREH